MHAHHAVQLCNPIGGNRAAARPGPAAPWRAYVGALIPSNQLHESDQAAPLIAACWFEPESSEARRLTPQQPARHPIVSLGRGKLAAIVPQLAEAWRECCPAARAAALIKEIVDILASRHSSRVETDPRIARALEIQSLTPEKRISVADVAAAVSLSPSRFSHLFTRAVGVPPRRRLLWLRLRDAVRELAGGASITDSAHAAGFADAPHLNRTFRRMLGFTSHAAVSMFVQDAQPRGW